MNLTTLASVVVVPVTHYQHSAGHADSHTGLIVGGMLVLIAVGLWIQHKVL